MKREPSNAEQSHESKRVKFENFHDENVISEQVPMDTVEQPDADSTNHQTMLDELIAMMPGVIESLKDTGHLVNYVEYTRLLSSGKMPLDSTPVI